VAAVVAVGTAGAVVTGIGTAVADGAGSVIGFVGSLAAAGAVQIVMPEMPADQPADKPAADKPAETANGDLLASWRKLVRDQDRAAADWQAATEALGKRTVAEGVIGWNTQLTLLEKITDENRAKMTAGAANADQALRVAVLEINGIDLMLLVVDQAVAEACDKLAAENRDPRISARIATVTAKVDDRTVQFNGTLTAVE
jgi:phospholipase/lecithinase/hemolysin